jgi:hypothetical protein
MATSSLASLVVSLEANVAQFNTGIKTASDQFDSFTKSISSGADLAKKALGALAGAVTVGAFVGMVKETIEATAALEKMAQKTGASVEALSAIRGAAKLVGTDMESVAQGIGKLDKAMLEAATKGGAAKHAFDSLGVAFKDSAGNLRNVDDVMLDLAKAFSATESGAQKTATAQILLGKAGKELIPVMNELGAAGEYNVKVTTQQAKIAEDFEKNLVRMGASGREMRQIFANEITPTLDALVKAFLSVINSSGGLIGKMRELAADGTLASWAQQTGFQLAKLADLMIDFGTTTVSEAKRIYAAAQLIIGGFKEIRGVDIFTSGKFSEGLAILREGAEDVKKAWANLTAPAAGGGPSTRFQDAFTTAVIAIGQMDSGLKKATGSLEAFGKAAKESMKAFNISSITAEIDKLGSEGAKLDAQIDSLQKYGQETKETALATAQFAVENGKLGETLKVLTILNPLLADALKNVILQEAKDNDEKRITRDLLKDAAADYKKYVDNLVAGVTSLQATAAIEKKRNDQFGLTAVEIADLNIVEEEHILEVLRAAEADEVAIKASELRLDSLQKIRTEIGRGADLQSWTASLNKVASGFSDFLVDIAEHGSSAFKNLWDNFKRWALQAIAEIAAKQIVVSLVGLLSIGGAAGAQAAGGLLSGGGGLGNIGQLLGLGTAGPGFLQGIGNIGFAVTDFTQLVGQGVGIMQSASTAFAGLGSSIAAVAGPIGLLVTGATALFSYLNSKKGGPMTREFGTSGADIGTFGDFSGAHKLVGNDAAASGPLGTFATTALNAYNGFLKTLGGTGAAQFAFYTSMDPRGTAPNQLDVRSTVGGRASYTANIENQLGRDPEVLKSRMQLEASRAILGALQMSDFPKYLANLFNSIDASTATEEQINNIVAIATALKQAVDLLPDLAGAFTSLDPASINALVDAVGGVEQFSASMGFLSANFSTAADAAEEAQRTLEEGFAGLGIAVPKTHDDFIALLNSFNLTTASGRALYASVLSLSGAFVEVRGTAEQAAQSLRQMTADLHSAIDDYNGVSGASSANEALLSDIHAFITENPWAQGTFDALGGEGFAQFLADAYNNSSMDADFAGYSESNQKLIISIIRHGAEIKSASDSIAKSVTDANAVAVAQYNALEQRANTEAAAVARMTQAGTTLGQQRSDLFGTFASQAGGDFGQQIALQIQYITTEIAKLQTSPKAALPKIASEIKALEDSGKALSQMLTLFTSLNARYGASIAEQLVRLTETFKTQSAQLEGNAAALDLLQASFESQWNAIINGTAAGVNGVQSELQRLQQGILDYVDSLKISAESPLTPVQKLAEARAQYEADLAKANAGDAKALGDVTGSADAFIKLARDFYASSSAYTDIFDMVTGQLTTLGTRTDLTIVPPMNPADQALLGVLPVGSKLMSAADMQNVAEWLRTGGQSPGADTLVGAVPGETQRGTNFWDNQWFNRPVAPSSDEGITASSEALRDAVYEGLLLLARTNREDSDRVSEQIARTGAATVEAIKIGRK